MEIIISVLLGIWIIAAGILCYVIYKKDYVHILKEINAKENNHK